MVSLRRSLPQCRSLRKYPLSTGRERRRQWRIAEKLRIVVESRESGARVCDIAARQVPLPPPD